MECHAIRYGANKVWYLMCNRSYWWRLGGTVNSMLDSLAVYPEARKCPTTIQTFNSCTKWPGNNKRHMPDCPPVSRALMRPQVALIRKLQGPLMCLAYFFDMSSLGICTTRHWQTSSRLVEKLNVCTVVAPLMGTLLTRRKNTPRAWVIYWCRVEDFSHHIVWCRRYEFT